MSYLHLGRLCTHVLHVLPPFGTSLYKGTLSPAQLNKQRPQWGTITNRGLRLFVKNDSCKIKKTLSLTKIVLGHNIDLGSRVILRPMYSGKLYGCKTITLSRTNIDLGHRGQIVLFFCSMSKVYVSEGNCSVFLLLQQSFLENKHKTSKLIFSVSRSMFVFQFAKFLSKRSLHDAVQVLNRRSCGDPGEILFRGFLHEDIADDIS